MPADCTSRKNVNGEMQARPFIGSDFFSGADFAASFGASHVRRICIIISGFGLWRRRRPHFKPERNYDLIDANNNGVFTP
jgi:hypothetical protein